MLKSDYYTSRLLELLLCNNLRNGVLEFESKKNLNKSDIINKAAQYDEHLGDLKDVVIIANNSIEWVILCLSCFLTGRKLYALDSSMTENDVKRILDEINPDIVFVDYVVRERINMDCHILSEFFADGCLNTDAHLSELVAGSLVLFTTGTTARPKGVVMELSNVIENLESLQVLFKILNFDDFLMTTSFSHAMGFIMMMLSICYGNIVHIVTDYNHIPYAFLTLKVDIMALPPTLLKMFSESQSFENKLKQMRFLICGSAGMNEQSYNDFWDKGIKVVNGYGMTECVSAISATRTDEVCGTDLMSVLPCCKIKLHSDGEILVKGHSVCKKYINGDSIVDGNDWYHTKDIGEFVNGKIRVLYRKDMVKVLSNGFKVNLMTVENKISELFMICDCQVYIEGQHDNQHIEANVVLKNEYLHTDPNELLLMVNDKLEFFEKISVINICKELVIRGGKKLYDINRNN